MMTLTDPVTVTVTFNGPPPVVIPEVILDGLSRQRVEIAVEAHLSAYGYRPLVLDIATPEGRPPSIAAITEQGVLTGTISS